MSIEELKTTVDDKTLSQVQDFLKLPPGVDEEILKIDILASRKSIITAVGEELDDFFDDNPQFQAAVMLNAATLYTNRNIESPSATFTYQAYPHLINSMKDEYRVKVELLTDNLHSDYDDIVDIYGKDNSGDDD